MYILIFVPNSMTVWPIWFSSLKLYSKILRQPTAGIRKSDQMELTPVPQASLLFPNILSFSGKARVAGSGWKVIALWSVGAYLSDQFAQVSLPLLLSCVTVQTKTYTPPPIIIAIMWSHIFTIQFFGSHLGIMVGFCCVTLG